MANTLLKSTEALVREFLTCQDFQFAPLNGVITDFSDEVANSKGVIKAQYAVPPASASDLSGGYMAAAEDVVATPVTVTLGPQKGFVWKLTEAELSEAEDKRIADQFLRPAAQTIEKGIFADLWNLVLAANFSGNTVSTAANMDRTVLRKCKTALRALNAPDYDRTIWLATDHYDNLVEDLLTAEFPGDSGNKQAGTFLARSFGFNVYEQSQADANSENLAGFAFHKSALAVGARMPYVDETTRMTTSVSEGVLPHIGIPFQIRHWFHDGSHYWAVVSQWGVGQGTDMGHRITTA